MNTNGRGPGGSSTHLEQKHPGNVGANSHGPSVSLARPEILFGLEETPENDRPAARARAPRSEPAPERTSASRARSAKSRVNLLVRRAHLYLGLVLLPFVALYGATALLFNHASWFRPVEERALDSRVLASSELALLTRDPAATARAIAPAGIDPIDARWEGTWSFESRADGRVERFDLDPRARGGRARAWLEDERPDSAMPASVATSTVPGWREPKVLAASIAPALGLRADDLSTKRAPRLAFTFREDGRELLARWDPANGSLRVTESAGRDTVDFLETLHVAHGSPGFVDARWWWSWIVDAMGFAMLAWAITGVWLWWTIRAVRFAGLVVLALAAALSCALVAGMHAAVPL